MKIGEYQSAEAAIRRIETEGARLAVRRQDADKWMEKEGFKDLPAAAKKLLKLQKKEAELQTSLSTAAKAFEKKYDEKLL